MTPKQYREFYIGCTKLYGVLESDIPPSAKQSLLKELATIKKEIEESKA